MKIRNTVSQAVFNYELTEGRELLDKYPHLKLEEASPEEKSAMQEKTNPTAEDRILGKTTEAEKKTADNEQLESKQPEDKKPNNEPESKQPEDKKPDNEPESKQPEDGDEAAKTDANEDTVRAAEDTAMTNKLTAPEAISIPATSPAENKILGKNAKKAEK